MIRSVRPRLNDIDDNITVSLDLVRGRTLKHLTHDTAFRYALQFALLVVAEGVRNLPDDLLAQAPEIPWPKIRAIGNHLRHEYHRIDPLIIWEVATNHLKPLRVIIRKMLTDLDQAGLPL